jgi:hypothetical protein
VREWHDASGSDWVIGTGGFLVVYSFTYILAIVDGA